MSGPRAIDDASGRRRTMLDSALGPAILAALGDSRVIEIMVNPDGVLRVDILGEGRADTGVTLDAAAVERIIRLVASQARGEGGEGAGIVSAELPAHAHGGGERFEGVLPPIVRGACFAIRKPACRIHSLMDYVADGIMAPETARLLSLAVAQRRTILVAGGTSSGKTTLANALLAEMAHGDERLVLIEDTRELQSPAPDTVALATVPGHIGMTELLRSTLRLRPDRIIIGEVRGPEALAMLKAWNTGHPGGIATVHANGAAAALIRLEQLVQEASAIVPRALIAEAVDMIVFLAGRGTGRHVAEMARLVGLRPDGTYDLRTCLFEDLEPGD